MPNVLEEEDALLEIDALDASLSAEEEQAIMARFAPTPNVGDLANGGSVNGAQLTPMVNGRPVQKGRAAARRAWSWNGTETMLPLAWNPDGTVHDGARRYLAKKVCLCCRYAGFKLLYCPNCRKSNCSICNGSNMKDKIIPCFYLRKEDVPFAEKFYGNIDCFLAICPRRGGHGFKTEQDMRMHARSRHRIEYQVHQETIAAHKADETEGMQAQIGILTAKVLELSILRPPPVKRRNVKVTCDCGAVIGGNMTMHKDSQRHREWADRVAAGPVQA